MTSKKRTQILQQLAELNLKEKELQAELRKLEAAKQFKCVWCDKKHAFKSCEAIQQHHWNSPQAYEDGYYTDAELYIICPTTGNTNRMLFTSAPYGHYRDYDYDANEQFKRKYTHAFKTVLDDRKDGVSVGNWRNNYYVDKNLNKFDIVVKGRTE